MEIQIEKAIKFATSAHNGQIRKWTGEFYINHPRRVATLVRDNDGSNNQIISAWLHDVVEDCPISFEQIRTNFGSDITEIVKQLTKPNIITTDIAEMIKMADITDNCSNIANEAPISKSYPYLIMKKHYVKNSFYKGPLAIIADKTIQNQLDELNA